MQNVQVHDWFISGYNKKVAVNRDHNIIIYTDFLISFPRLAGQI